MGNLVEAGSKYSDADRRSAVAQCMLLGNVSATARATGIPRRTIGTWTQSDWWVPLEAELRQQIDDEILAQTLQIIIKAQAAILDRLESGDAHLVNGEQVRVPVKARDLAIILGISAEQYLRWRNLPSLSQKEHVLETVKDMLRNLGGQSGTAMCCSNKDSQIAALKARIAKLELGETSDA